MADQNITALPKKTPVDGDYLLGIGTSEEYQMLLSDLADVILNKLTSKTFALDAGTSTLISALNTLNSKRTFLTTETSSLLDSVINQDNNTICFYFLPGSVYSTEDIPGINYKWGTAIGINRTTTSRTVIIFPESSGIPMVNYWLMSSNSWTGWKSFTE